MREREREKERDGGREGEARREGQGERRKGERVLRVGDTFVQD